MWGVWALISEPDRSLMSDGDLKWLPCRLPGCIPEWTEEPPEPGGCCRILLSLYWG